MTATGLPKLDSWFSQNGLFNTVACNEVYEALENFPLQGQSSNISRSTLMEDFQFM